MAGHGHHGIHDVRVIVFRHKARAQARDVVPSDVPAADGLALVRLYGNHLYIRVPCLDVFAHARNSAAAAYARNNRVQRAARCLGDVRARYTAVKFSVQVIVEIVQEIAARLLHGLLRALLHAPAAVNIVGKHDLRAELRQHLLTLQRHGSRHAEHQRVAAVGAGHGQRHGKAAAGTLDHRLARLQKAFFCGQSQHSFGQRVLCGARRPAVGQICIQGIRQIVLRTVPGKRHHGAAVQRFIIAFVDIQNETAPFPAKPHTISRLLYYKIPVLGMRFP